MLEAARARFALEMQIDPAGLLVPFSLCQPLLLFGGKTGGATGGRREKNKSQGEDRAEPRPWPPQSGTHSLENDFRPL